VPSVAAMSPTSHRRASRAAVLLATTALAAGGLVAAAPPSGAVVYSAIVVAEVSADGTQDGTGDTCNATPEPADKQANLVPGQTRTLNLSGGVTVTDPDDATDTAEYAFGGRVQGRLDVDGGRPTRFVADARQTVSADFSKGAETNCLSNGEAFSGVQTEFSINRTQLVTLTSVTKGDMNTFVIVENSEGRILVDVSSFEGRRSTTFLAPRGQYRVQAQFETVLESPTSEESVDVAGGTGSVTMRLATPGSATAPTTGTGKAFVQLPGERGCGDGSLAVKLTPKAKQLKRVTYYVNGRRSGFDTTPTPGYQIRYNLPLAKPVTFKVVAQPKQGKQVAVTRTYLACTP
jgi:hypothetical protein